MRATFFFQLVRALTMDSWVGPFLRGGLTKHYMTPSETAHRNTEKLHSLKLTCLVRLTGMITNGTWVADSKLTTLLCNFLNDSGNMLQQKNCSLIRRILSSFLN
ncbi:uncharacterized protein LOC131066074 isoform X4 [Cryptomeria japonica]|uniref:uncharacterized protein LOC131066074 isoform X4 n=1 Tax=Cryptomeria japonica TaxID=3369 RepID=UPI0027DA1287|nr:uncharacterized protein LOC131066074 isoform X4 [Cryptomeria japonica]